MKEIQKRKYIYILYNFRKKYKFKFQSLGKKYVIPVFHFIQCELSSDTIVKEQKNHFNCNFSSYLISILVDLILIIAKWQSTMEIKNFKIDVGNMEI